MPLEAPHPALPASQRSLIESMPFPVFIRGRDNRYLACNRLFQEFIGHGEDEVVGRTATDLAGAEMGRAYDLQCAEVWVEARPLSHHAVVMRADGVLRQVRFHRSILRADDGGVLGLIGVMEDVTEERQATAALAESEARFSRLAELTAEGVVLHADGLIIDVNDAMVRMLGWPREQLVGRHYSVLLTPENLEKTACCVEDRIPGCCRTELARSDGSILPVEIRSRAVTHDGKEISVATVSDISSRLAAEQALRERELLYRQMFENNRVVKLLIDPDSGQIVDANPAAAQFYGWSLDQLRLMNITHINALPAEQVKAEMDLARNEARNFFRFRHRTAHGDVRQVEVFSGPCHFHGRSLLHSIIIDVTARERAVAELRRKSEALELSNADLQQFAYVASHDLQEPLRSVVSYLQLLQRRYQGKLDAEADEFIGFAVSGAKRMSALIQDLLLYSRVDAQGHPLEPVECDEVMASTLANLHFLLEAMEATVEVVGPLPRVLGDAPQLSSVLQNLIGNAVKYRDRERKPLIRISAEPGEAGEWVFSVADNGIGIDPEYHDRIFKIFQRLHTQTEYPGTGIGLALVRRIISRHGGRIWVDTQPEGQHGTTFRFTLQGA